MDSKVLITSPFQRRNILCVLTVAFQWLGNAIPFDEFIDRHRSSVESLDGVLETVEYRVRRPGRIKPFETRLLDILDERRSRALARLDASDLELVGASHFAEVFSSARRRRSRVGARTRPSHSGLRA